MVCQNKACHFLYYLRGNFVGSGAGVREMCYICNLWIDVNF